MDRRQLLNLLRLVCFGMIAVIGVWLLLYIPGIWEMWNFHYYQNQYRHYKYSEAQAANPFISVRNSKSPPPPDIASLEELEKHLLYQDCMIAAGETKELKRQYTAFSKNYPQNPFAAALAYRVTADPRLESLLLQVLKKSPFTSPVVSLALLENRVRNGYAKDAETLLAPIPSNHWLHAYWAAEIYYQLGRRNSALQEFQKTLAFPHVPISVALACAPIFNESKTEPIFDPFSNFPPEKVQSEPLAAAFHITRATGNFSEQIRQLSKAVLYNIEALSLLANHAVRQKEYAVAHWLLRRGLRFRPNHPDFLITAGILAAKENQPQRSDALFSWGINPPKTDLNAEFHHRMGYLLLLADQVDFAVPHLVCAKSELLETPEIQKNLGMHYVKTKQYEQALPYLERANEQTPRDIPTLKALTDAYLSQGKKEKAIVPLTVISGIDFDNMEARDQLANIFLEQNQFNVAVSLYDLYLDRYPDSGLAYLKIAELYKKTGKVDRAVQILSSILEANPKLKDRELIEKTIKAWNGGNR